MCDDIRIEPNNELLAQAEARHAVTHFDEIAEKVEAAKTENGKYKVGRFENHYTLLLSQLVIDPDSFSAEDKMLMLQIARYEGDVCGSTAISKLIFK